MDEDKCNLPAGIESQSGMVWDGCLEPPSLGPCCACGGVVGVDALVMINRKCQVADRGVWGCLTCGATDGAAVVLCKACRESGTPIRWGCRGRPGEDGRAPIEEFTEICEHDLAKHPELACPAE